MSLNAIVQAVTVTTTLACKYKHPSVSSFFKVDIHNINIMTHTYSYCSFLRLSGEGSVMICAVGMMYWWAGVQRWVMPLRCPTWVTWPLWRTWSQVTTKCYGAFWLTEGCLNQCELFGKEYECLLSLHFRTSVILLCNTHKKVLWVLLKWVCFFFVCSTYCDALLARSYLQNRFGDTF